MNNPGYDTVAAELIRRKAAQLKRRVEFRYCDVRDLRHDLTADFWARHTDFDHRRGSWPAFVRKIVDHHAATMIARQWTATADPRHMVSLNVMVECDDGCAQLGDTLEESIHERRGRHYQSVFAAVDLRLDIETVLQRLPAKDRLICRLLLTLSPTEIESRAGIARSTLYNRLQHIRAPFEAAELKNFC